MQRYYLAGAVALSLCAMPSIAHEGVRNPGVLARMENMSSMADQLKVIGTMARSLETFDVVAAQNAAIQIASLASATPELFRENHVDAKSEASPDIWTAFDDFEARAAVMEQIARAVSDRLQSRDDLRPALTDLAEGCSACHTPYRIER